MSTIELVEHLTTIFMDLALPALGLYLVTLIRQWLPKESSTHGQVSDMMQLLSVFLRAEAAAKSAAQLSANPVPPPKSE